MNVVIGNNRYTLEKADEVGFGGEGNVYKKKLRGASDYVAIKIYHKPTLQRGKKLEAMIKSNWNLPANKLAKPLELVYDEQGNVIGFTMPYLGSGFEELSSLAKKNYRASFMIGTRQVVAIFIDGAKTLAAIHSVPGLRIGDFSDKNEMFRAHEMLFIDVDAYQFGDYICPVGTEGFLDPKLYGIDLSLKAVFEPQHDNYAYAVNLFRSLLLVHPYGGTHPNYKKLTDRATARLTVFDPKVTYPVVAISPDILDDDLAHTFDLIFSKGQRMPFPIHLLEVYGNSLVDCPKCKTEYPSTRGKCPVCSEQNLIVSMKPSSVSKGTTSFEFIKTQGNIIYSRLVGSKLFVIAYENGKTVFYAKQGNLPPIRRELFSAIPGAKFELVGEDILVIGQPNSEELMLFDISDDNFKPILKTETATYLGNRRAMFRTSEEYLFRIAGGSLQYGKLIDGDKGKELVERQLRPVMNNHTWFNVKQEANGEKPTAFGFSQMKETQFFWLVWEGKNYDNLPFNQMDENEVLEDISVKFSSQGAAVRRSTKYQGINYLRTEMVNEKGEVIYSSPRIKAEDHPAKQLHGSAYSTGVYLHATEEGILQEKVATKSFRTFDSTKDYVSEGDTLYVQSGGQSLLVVKGSVVTKLTLG